MSIVEEFWKNDPGCCIMILGSIILFLIIMFVYPRIKSYLIRREEFWPLLPIWSKQYGIKLHGKYEQRCREIFERLFNKPFNKIRPKWLKNTRSGRSLELDGFCPDEKLAFEYNGIQHEQLTPHWHKRGENDLIEQKMRDLEKMNTCKRMGVNLVVIPHTIKYERLEDYIRSQLKLIYPDRDY